MALIVKLNAAWNSIRLDFDPLMEREEKMSARLGQRMKMIAEAATAGLIDRLG